MTNNKFCEILAPCGSYDILVAAINAGADACYLGGDKFGARAFAQNFDQETLIKAIDFAHLNGAKIYLTVNTLFKNKEIKQLYDYLAPLYEAGLDAVIVQDLGVFSCVKKYFPDLNIHCSTQMNITSYNAAVMMHDLGASRVVTAREMNLSEIKAIKDKVPQLEIETFVHGAMCYSYSGQCLMSSMAGGRSGNRGRCAQPCRKCYDGEYSLSMKDMCAIEYIPELLEAGIDSLKIEGRMKNEYYVASSVDAYKEMVLDYYNGFFNKDKARKLKNKLANIYNRGGFCDGYFYKHNGADMISINRPNNQGINIGKLVNVLNGKINIKLCESLYKQDVLEIMLKDKSIIEITSGICGNKGETVTLNCPKTKLVKEGTAVYRTRCNYILEDVKSTLIDKAKSKIALKCDVIGKIGEALKVSLSTFIDNKCFVYEMNDCILEKSQNQVFDINKFEEKFDKLGDTNYIFSELNIDIDSDAFIPASIPKRIRRDAIAGLEDEIKSHYKRKPIDRFDSNINESDKQACVNETEAYTSNFEKPLFIVGVSNINQFRTVLKFNIDAISISENLYKEAKKTDLIDAVYNRKIKIFIEMPNIFKSSYQSLDEDDLNNVHGIYTKNIDSYAYIKNKGIKDKIIILAASLYGYNDMAVDFLGDEYIYELPKELNEKELSSLTKNKREVIIYEYQQVMLSAQCIAKTRGKCDKSYGVGKIKDDLSNEFYYMAKCDECCNIIYNGVPYCIADAINETFVRDYNVKYIRCNFTVEDCGTVEKILDLFSINNIYSIEKSDIVKVIGNTTSGHFYRGVD